MNDTLMRFFDKCPRFIEEVDKNPDSMAERNKFEVGPEMQRVEEKMADRLGLPYNLINAGGIHYTHVFYLSKQSNFIDTGLFVQT